MGRLAVRILRDVSLGVGEKVHFGFHSLLMTPARLPNILPRPFTSFFQSYSLQNGASVNIDFAETATPKAPQVSSRKLGGKRQRVLEALMWKASSTRINSSSSKKRQRKPKIPERSNPNQTHRSAELCGCRIRDSCSFHQYIIPSALIKSNSLRVEVPNTGPVCSPNTENRPNLTAPSSEAPTNHTDTTDPKHQQITELPGPEISSVQFKSSSLKRQQISNATGSENPPIPVPSSSIQENQQGSTPPRSEKPPTSVPSSNTQEDNDTPITTPILDRPRPPRFEKSLLWSRRRPSRLNPHNLVEEYFRQYSLEEIKGLDSILSLATPPTNSSKFTIPSSSPLQKPTSSDPKTLRDFSEVLDHSKLPERPPVLPLPRPEKVRRSRTLQPISSDHSALLIEEKPTPKTLVARWRLEQAVIAWGDQVLPGFKRYVIYDPSVQDPDSLIYRQKTLEKICASQTRMEKWKEFRVFGTAEHFKYDLLKCWALLNQHLHGRMWPPGYEPVTSREALLDFDMVESGLDFLYQS